MLRATTRPCIPNCKIKARILTLATTKFEHRYMLSCLAFVYVFVRLNTRILYNKSNSDMSTEYGTICLEGGWRHSYRRGRGCVGAGRQFTVARRVVRQDPAPSHRAPPAGPAWTNHIDPHTCAQQVLKYQQLASIVARRTTTTDNSRRCCVCNIQVYWTH